MRPITVIGIDPGASGALCFTSSEKKDMYTYKCHELISGRRVTASMAANAYRSYETIAYIENGIYSVCLKRGILVF